MTPMHCFQHRKMLVKVQALSTRGDIQVCFANEREDFIPEKSFGAEVVPEGQRPVNEYLEMRRSPLFEWASNEVGTKGVRSFSLVVSMTETQSLLVALTDYALTDTAFDAVRSCVRCCFCADVSNDFGTTQVFALFGSIKLNKLSPWILHWITQRISNCWCDFYARWIPSPKDCSQ